MFLFRRVCEKIKSSQESSREEAKVDTFILSRLCYLLGQVALCQLNYLDVNLFNELKRRNYLREQKAEMDKKQKVLKQIFNFHQSQHLTKHLSRRMLRRRRPREPQLWDWPPWRHPRVELMMMTWVWWVLRLMMRRQSSSGMCVRRRSCTEEPSWLTSLLSSLPSAPTLPNIQVNIGQQIKDHHEINHIADPDLRASASLALSKFMLVSSEFCEQNLQLVCHHQWLN